MKIITFTLALLTSAVTLGQDFKLYEKAVFTFENDTLNYRILKPLNYDSNKQYPVLLFLHGDGSNSRDFTYIDNVISMNLLVLSTTKESALNLI